MAGEIVDGVYYSDEALEKRQLLLDLINNPPQDQEGPDPFIGYGRVVDQNGNPVVNAKVKAQWWRNEIVRGVGIKTHTDTTWVSTSQDGYFSVTTPNGAIPTLYGVKAKGYEEKWGLTPYANAGNDQDGMMKNSKNEPIILHMRKLNPTTFLLKSKSGYYVKEQIATIRYTMIPKILGTPNSENSGDTILNY